MKRIALTLVAASGLALPALAQKPDGQVLVAPGLPGRWQVSLVLQHDESRAKLQERLKTLTTLLPGKYGSVELNRRQIGPVTFSTVSFITAAELVNSKGDMAVAPFVVALRDLDRVQVTYMTPEKFTYKGVRQFTDNGVTITVDSQPSALSYLAEIKNHNVTGLNPPITETTAPKTASRSTMGTGRILGVLLVILLAIGAAFVTFGLLQRRVRR
ncbi:MAG: hypothetical protein QM758_27965 [Armatimonas sp.]